MDERTPAMSQTSDIPAQIHLEDFVEAVSKGVLRALQAENDVAGYAAGKPLINRPLVFGWIIGPDGPWTQQPGGFGGAGGPIAGGGPRLGLG